MGADYQKGLMDGIELMEQRLLIACESGSPINIEGKAFFIRSDVQNLRDIFADLEEEEGEAND